MDRVPWGMIGPSRATVPACIRRNNARRAQASGGFFRVKVTLPEALKTDLPPGFWGKILSATPVAMAVVATMLAGLASSEMTKAQYDRSLAAQRQSKAGDQWSFFQAKRLRGALQRSTLDLMVSSAEVHPLQLAALRQVLAGTSAGAGLESTAGQQALRIVADGVLPKPPPSPEMEGNVQAALQALENSRPESEVLALVAKVDDGALENTLREARAQALAFDALIKPIGQTVDLAERELAGQAGGAAHRRDFIAARLTYTAARYDSEARLNQSIASLYELQVRKGNLSAERHHRRSQKFFYGMLAAQMGVIISTLAMAARKRNLLWGLAAAAGSAAIAFAVYVYLFV